MILHEDQHLRVEAHQGLVTILDKATGQTHVSVPREPTLEMKYEGMEAADCDIGLVTVGNIYRAILSRLGGSND